MGRTGDDESGATSWGSLGRPGGRGPGPSPRDAAQKLFSPADPDAHRKRISGKQSLLVSGKRGDTTGQPPPQDAGRIHLGGVAQHEKPDSYSPIDPSLVRALHLGRRSMGRGERSESHGRALTGATGGDPWPRGSADRELAGRGRA